MVWVECSSRSLTWRGSPTSNANVDATVEAFGRDRRLLQQRRHRGHPNLTEDYGSAEFAKVLSVNLTGVFLGLEKVLKVMHQQGRGAVVNTASVGGIRGVGNQSGYAAAKHGVVGLTRNSAIEYGQFGIQINAIAPGAIMTPMVDTSMKQLDPENPPKGGEQFVSASPTNRYGDVARNRRACRVLALQDATYINGDVIPIDGGQSYKY